MRLTEQVWLVASGDSGVGLTDPWDAHAYLVDGGGEAALVDAGLGRDPDALLTNVRAAGVDPATVRHVVVTHAHPDHAGGAGPLADRLPELAVVASPRVAGWIRDADEQAMSLEVGKRAEFYPPDHSVQPCPRVRGARDGERLRVGACELELVATPGHSAGHCCVLLHGGDRSVLFTGDCVFWGGQVSLTATWDCDVPAYGRSLARLARLHVDAMLPGHHAWSLSRGQRHIDAAHRRFSNGFVPPSIV